MTIYRPLELAAHLRTSVPRVKMRPVPPGLVLLANGVVGLALLAAAVGGGLVRSTPRRAAALAVVPLVSVVIVTLYVFGEDSYRGNGISRWEAYRSPGGALGPMYVLSVAFLVGCAALLWYGGQRDSRGLVRVTAFAAGVTSLVALTATIVGFTAN